MATHADEIIDRRRLRKKLSFWRIITFIILGVALLAMVGFGANKAGLSNTKKEYIAKVSFTGVITNDEPMLDLLESLKEDKKAKAVIIHVSSPGGSTVGGEAMFEAIRELAEVKPVTATVGTLAASAGYMIASATDHIVARRSSIVGSIGVLFQYADASQLLDKIGVKVKAIKSSPLKAEPSPFNPTSEEAVAMIDRLIQDSYKWFVDIVVDRRDMTRFEVLKLADGSIYTGNQSLENGLIDAIGGEAVAVKWLNEEKDISDTLKVIVRKPIRPTDSIFSNPAALYKVAKIFGIEMNAGEAKALEDALRERLPLDGLVSIWQGSPR